MTTGQPDIISSDYTVMLLFRVFKRAWIHRKYFTLRPSNNFRQWADNDPWMEHTTRSLYSRLRDGWPVPIPSAEWNHSSRVVEVFGDDLLLCPECGDFIPFRDRRDGWSRETECADTETFTTSGGKHFRSGWFLCNWLADAYDPTRNFADESSTLSAADAKLIRKFSESRLKAPEFSLTPCGEVYCLPKKRRGIKEFEAYLKRTKARARPEVSLWIAEKKKPQKPEKTYDDFVYLVHASGHWKLGVSQNVEQRLRELQTGCPFRVEIVKFWKSEQATKVERALHRRFAEHRMEGEWFKLPESALTYLNGIDDLDREFLTDAS